MSGFSIHTKEERQNILEINKLCKEETCKRGAFSISKEGREIIYLKQ